MAIERRGIECNDQKTVTKCNHEHPVFQDILEVIQTNKINSAGQTLPIKKTVINGLENGINNKKKEKNNRRQEEQEDDQVILKSSRSACPPFQFEDIRNGGK
jgi:hypothetical protein